MQLSNRITILVEIVLFLLAALVAVSSAAGMLKNNWIALIIVGGSLACLFLVYANPIVCRYESLRQNIKSSSGEMSTPTGAADMKMKEIKNFENLHPVITRVVRKLESKGGES